MNKQMIENSERGITIAKPLAWTMLVGLVGAGWFLGERMQQVHSGIVSLEQRQVEDRQDIRTNTSDINELQRTVVRVDQRLIAIERSSRRTEATMLEVMQYLQEAFPQERGGR